MIRADWPHTIQPVPGQPAHTAPQTAGLISARLVLDAGDDVPDIAERLGINAAQLAWGGDGALHAELDVPAGSWRVYPPFRVALWISLRPGDDPPPAPPGRRLRLGRTVRRLRRRGARSRDLQVCDGEVWSVPLRASEALAVLKTSDPFGICAIWSCHDRQPARIEIYDDGTLWASTPADAHWWAMEAAACE
jgi:hypothetical protein